VALPRPGRLGALLSVRQLALGCRPHLVELGARHALVIGELITEGRSLYADLPSMAVARFTARSLCVIC
jgi:hypothetical protein